MKDGKVKSISKSFITSKLTRLFLTVGLFRVASTVHLLFQTGNKNEIVRDLFKVPTEIPKHLITKQITYSPIET